MKGWMRVLLWTTLVLGALVGVLRYWFVDFYQVPDEPSDPRAWANAPNLEPGDWVLVWRGGTPHGGDLVRCPDPYDPQRWLIGRVVGLPGDKIEWNETGLVMNNFRVRSSACDKPARKVFSPDYNAEVELPCQGEEIGGSRHDTYSSLSMPAVPPLTVEAGKYWLLSDNRFLPWAHDSRVVGTVPVEACKQRLMLRLWSKKGWSDDERRMTFLF